ncbi:MAG: 30S ribosome-binding factor RbfA [Acidobacteriota bacterium]
MTGRRPERLAEQIKEEISLIISGELDDPRIGFVTVTDTKVSPDLKYAKIFVSVMGEDQQVAESMKALDHASGFIRHRLGSVMRIKRAPELRFIYDDTEKTAARIEELLSEEVQKAKDDDASQNG